MPRIFDLDDDEVMSIKEYEHFVIDNVDLGDYDSICGSAVALRRLANDREFILEAYHQEIINILEGRLTATLSPQSIYLVRRPDFLVRANIWLPAVTDPLQRARDQKLYSYALPHDHNFDFLTVGYYGEGYTTDLYTHDRSSLVGYMGEKTHVTYVGREKLTPGRVMSYQAGVDIHTQHEPERVSLSLNLLPINLKHLNSPQYVFDEHLTCLSGGVSDQVASRLFLLDFFRTIHNEDTIDYLAHVMETYKCPRTRGYALGILEEIRPNEREYFRAKCAADDWCFARPDMVSASHNRL